VECPFCPLPFCLLSNAFWFLPWSLHNWFILHSSMSQKEAPPTITLRPVTPADEEFLLELYGNSRADELNQVEWGEGQREIFVRWQFDMQRREYFARFPEAKYQLILIDGDPAGRIWIGEDEEEIHLLDITLLAQFQKRGAGTVLLNGLMKQAKGAGKSLRHSVFVLNNDAYRFYERLGFVVTEDIGAYKHMEWRPTHAETSASTET
jgi:ribosomal protein S18 acetylase RimI-like enzyme